jgi:hypothetical protein
VKNSTARKLKQIGEGNLLVGTDPHKAKHALLIMSQDAMVKKRFKITNTK